MKQTVTHQQKNQSNKNQQHIQKTQRCIKEAERQLNNTDNYRRLQEDATLAKNEISK